MSDVVIAEAVRSRVGKRTGALAPANTADRFAHMQLIDHERDDEIDLGSQTIGEGRGHVNAAILECVR